MVHSIGVFFVILVGADIIRPVKIKMIFTNYIVLCPFRFAKWAGG